MPRSAKYSVKERKARNRAVLARPRHEAHDATRDYLTRENFEARLRAAHAVGKSNDADHIAESGAMLLELAFQAPDPVQQIQLFESARSSFHHSLDRGKFVRHSRVLRAAMYMNHVDLFQYLLLDVKPPVEAVQATYRQNLDFAARLNEVRTDTAHASVDERCNAAGALAETSVLLLLQRFAVRDLGDASWLAVPSFYSEDNTIGQCADGANSWDVSVYTDPTDTGSYELTYPIQVKTSRAQVEADIPYQPGIQLVYLKDDLNLRSNIPGSSMPIASVFNELQLEASAATDDTRPPAAALLGRISGRTDLLLERIDA